MTREEAEALGRAFVACGAHALLEALRGVG